MLIKNLVNNPKNRKEIDDILNYYGTEIDFDETCEVRVPRSIKNLVKACDDILDVVKIMEGLVLEVKSQPNYTIEEITADLDVNKLSFRCIICFQVDTLDQLSILNCCSSMGHLIHIQNWIDKHDSCPFCKRSDFNILKPIEN